VTYRPKGGSDEGDNPIRRYKERSYKNNPQVTSGGVPFIDLKGFKSKGRGD